MVIIVGGPVRNQYVRAKVEKVFIGRDGRVRQALVRTATGVYKRPVVKLALLDVESVGEADKESADHHQASREGDCYNALLEDPPAGAKEVSARLSA